VMMHKANKTLISAAAAAAISLATAWLSAPVAHAETPDEVYLRLLTEWGVSHPDDAAALQTGNTICAQVRAGVDPQVIQDRITGAGFDPTRTGVIMGATGAPGSLCPDIAPRLHALWDPILRANNEPIP
jgi:hypothetical protein